MEACRPKHDWFTAALTFGLCCGLVASYVPQHLRIITSGTSEGLSPYFLLLGSTSAAAGMLNLFVMQWGIIKCCQYISSASCVEMTAGEFQVGLQWLMFTLIFVLYMMYYPPHLKYLHHGLNPDDIPLNKTPPKSEDWKASIVLSWLTAAHFFIIFIVTVALLYSNPVPPSRTPLSALPGALYSWARFLGVSSAVLAGIQYLPQLVRTYRMRLVGALSIPMFCIQSPGAILMVASIALRPGTNWTSWITYAVAGIMQGCLLVMCIVWKVRQYRLGVDDFGNPVASRHIPALRSTTSEYEEVPGLVLDREDEDDAKAVTKALANALGDAVNEDIRDSGGLTEIPEIRIEGRPVEDQATEDTPLLPHSGDERQRKWKKWFTRS